MAKQVGSLSARIISALELSLQVNQPIFLGESNIAHMKKRHPEDYLKYGTYLEEILAAPDYAGVNQKDGSIEYVKEFQIEDEYVKVAVRLSGNQVLYARSLYVLNRRRTENFIQKGTLKKI